MRLNSQMKSLIDRHGFDIERPGALHPALSAILEGGLACVNGAVVLNARLQRSSAVSFSDFPDETGFESFVNHIHVEDYVPHENGSPVALMAAGLSLARSLRSLLCERFPGEEFEIIVSFQKGHATVRFHKKRTGEQLLSENLDDYREEALMVL